MPDIVEMIAYRIAVFLKRINPEQTADIETMYNWLAFKVADTLIVSLSLLIGSLSGQFIYTSFSLLAFWSLRKLTGGFHLNSLTSCVVVTTVLLSCIPHINYVFIVKVAISLISLIVVWFYGAKTYNLSNEYKTKFKIFGIIMITIGLISPINVLTTAFFAQSVTLIELRR